jgi:hypothetical protein
MAQALDAIFSCFGTIEKDEQEKETRRAYHNPLRRRLFLGTLLDRHGGANSK